MVDGIKAGGSKLVAFVFLLLTAIAAWETFHTDISSADVAGHWSSAVHFNEGLFHRHEDAHFLGAIHGLFYPPLEDVMLGGILRVAEVLHVGAVPAFRFYLFAVALAYLAAMGRLAWRMKGFRAQAAFTIVFATHFLLFQRTATFAGLRLGDLTTIGLSSQFIGGAAFFLLLEELSERRRAWLAGVLLSVCIFSHIIMGMCAAIWLVGCVLESRQRSLVVALAFAAGLTAVFWFPFVVHSEWLLKNELVGDSPPYATLAACLVVVTLVRSDPVVLRRCLLPLAFLVASAAAFHAKAAGWSIPKFHFYRLEPVALLSIAFVVARTDDSRGSESSTSKVWPGYLLLIGVLVDVGRIGVYRPVEGSRAGAEIAGFRPDLLAAEPYGRLALFEKTAGYDIGIESILTATYRNLRVEKGLFWEASPANNLLNSDLVTMGGTSAVLVHVRLVPKPDVDQCALAACMFDQFLADYNVRWLSYEPRNSVSGWWGATCFARAWDAGGTQNFRFDDAFDFTVGPRRFPVRRVVPTGKGFDNAAVELVSRAPEPLTALRTRVFEQYFLQTVAKCDPTKGEPDSRRVALVPKKDVARMRPEPTDESPTASAPPLIKLAAGAFRLDAPRGAKRLYRVKLSPLPGLVVRDENGVALPWSAGFPHIFVLADGPALITFEATWAMKVGVGTTLCALAVAVALGIRAFVRRGT